MKKSKNIVIITIIILVIVLFVGSTFSYWQWNSNNIVSISLVTDTGAQVGLTLDGGSNANDRPLFASECTSQVYANQKTLTISRYNTSSSDYSALLTLTLTDFTWNAAKPSSNDLSYIKYIITSKPNDCTTSIVNNTSGNFSSVLVSNSSGSNYSQNTVLIEWNYTIPRNSGTSSNKIEETYYLYYWLDSSYEFTNIGDNVVSDPLENINFSMSWSGSDLVELS